jgi:hypothetical protein
MTKYSKFFLSLLLITVFVVVLGCSGLFGNVGNNSDVKKGNLDPGSGPVATYKNTCGQCHIPYPPHFLPSGSWEKLLGSTGKHFGETLEIEQKDKDIIVPYLKENGAEHSQSKIPQRIMQSLEGNTPLRLTEVPYIVNKHRKISSDIFQRKSIGAFANCNACHRLADNWIFDKKISTPK